MAWPTTNTGFLIYTRNLWFIHRHPAVPQQQATEAD